MSSPTPALVSESKTGSFGAASSRDSDSTTGIRLVGRDEGPAP